MGRFIVFAENVNNETHWGVYDEMTGSVVEWFATKHEAESFVPEESEMELEIRALPDDVAREYFMERRYHGVSHEEALRRAWDSPWIRKEVK